MTSWINCERRIRRLTHWAAGRSHGGHLECQTSKFKKTNYNKTSVCFIHFLCYFFSLFRSGPLWFVWVVQTNLIKLFVTHFTNKHKSLQRVPHKSDLKTSVKMVPVLTVSSVCSRSRMFSEVNWTHQKLQ